MNDMPETYDADRIVALLCEKGLTAFVWQSGGGSASVVASKGEHDVMTIAGPGAYGWGERASTLNRDEVYIGWDDDGDTHTVTADDAGCRNEEDVADLIALHVTKCLPGEVLHSEVLEAAGFDGTGRGLPRRPVS